MRWLAILMLSAVPAMADSYKINRVIDGDTVEIAVDFLPSPLPPKLSVRILGIDTPEKAPRAKCEAEAEKAKLAKWFTQRAVEEANRIDINIREWDKFGGRVLGLVFIDGQNLGDMLIKAGLARPYKGEAKSSWCE
jgi:endonuclease YncB( thermonuclease family)